MLFGSPAFAGPSPVVPAALAAEDAEDDSLARMCSPDDEDGEYESLPAPAPAPQPEEPVGRVCKADQVCCEIWSTNPSEGVHRCTAKEECVDLGKDVVPDVFCK